MRGWAPVRGAPSTVDATVRQQRTRSVAGENVQAMRDRALGRADKGSADGQVSSEKISKLCGEHLEHVYEALRLTTPGTQPVTCSFYPASSAAGTIITIGTASNAVAVYDITAGARLSASQKGPRRCSCAFTPSLSHVAVYGDPVAPAIELQHSGGRFAFLEGHTAQVRCCCLAADGSVAVSGGRDGQLFLWLLQQGPAAGASTPAASPGVTLQPPHNNQQAPWQQQPQQQGQGSPQRGPSPPPAQLLQQQADGELSITRIALEGHGAGATVKCVCLSGDGSTAASGASDGTVIIWAVPSGQLLEVLPLPPAVAAAAAAAAAAVATPAAAGSPAHCISCCALSWDGSLLVTGNKAGRVALSQRVQGTAGSGSRWQLHELPQRHSDGGKVRSVAVSPDGSKLASAGDDCKVVLWDATTRTPLLAVGEHARPVRCCTFSPDGRYIATCGDDSLICRFEVATLISAAASTAGAAAAASSGLRSAVLMGQPQAPPPGDAVGMSMGGTPGVSANGIGTSLGHSRRTSQQPQAQQQQQQQQQQSALQPLLQRVQASRRERLLDCSVIMSEQPVGSPDQGQASLGLAGSQASVLCAEQCGTVLLLEPGDAAARPVAAAAEPMACCCFDGDVLATAKRDGSVTVMSCSSAPSPPAAKTGAPGAAAAGTAAQPYTTKLDMLVFGISLNTQLGRVAVAGSERKAPQSGVLWVWEYDPVDYLLNSSMTGPDGLQKLSSIALGGAGASSLRATGSGVRAAGREGLAGAGRANSGPVAMYCGGDTFGSPRGGSLVTAFGGSASLFKRDNPLQVFANADAALLCCAWATRGERCSLVAGSAGGWLVVVELDEAMDVAEEAQVRYQMHSREVTACALAADGDTVASAGIDGKVLLWSATTGAQLHVFTLHSSEVRSLNFNTECTRLAAADARGLVSAWDVRFGMLLSGAQVHEGAATSARFSACSGVVVTCGYDGVLGFLQVEAPVGRLYRNGFRALYSSCKKSNKVHKLELALTWHMRHGIIQDASVLQALVFMAAADGNAAVLCMLLPLFERAGWLVHFGPLHPTAAIGPRRVPTDRSLTHGSAGDTNIHTHSTAGAQNPDTRSPTLARRSAKLLGGAAHDLRQLLASTLNPTDDGAPARQLPAPLAVASPRQSSSPAATPPCTTPARLTPTSSRNARMSASLETLPEGRAAEASTAQAAAAAAEASNATAATEGAGASAAGLAPQQLAPQQLAARLMQQQHSGRRLWSWTGAALASSSSSLPHSDVESAGTAGSAQAAATQPEDPHQQQQQQQQQQQRWLHHSTSSNMLSDGRTGSPGAPPLQHQGSITSRMARRTLSLKQRLLLLPFGASGSGNSELLPSAAEGSAVQSEISLSSKFAAVVGAAVEKDRHRGILTSWTSWRRGSKTAQAPVQQQTSSLQGRHPKAHKKEDLLQLSMASQHAACVRVVVDALVEGRFSRASVMMHLYEALMALIHDQQHKRVCRRLLKHLPLHDNGEVEVDSMLTWHSNYIYKCSAHGNPCGLWSSADAAQQPLLEALDVLIKRSSWRDSVTAVLLLPIIKGLRHLGAFVLWLSSWIIKRRTRRAKSQAMQVSATSKLLPVLGAAEIRKGSKNLLRQLVSANVDADVYGKEIVKAVISVKWDSFAKAFLLKQLVQFMVFFILFLAYLAFAVYHNDPQWTIGELVRQPAGQAAIVLECILVIMMCGQAADEVKQMVTYKHEYFNSPWNYMDVLSCLAISIISLLHITRRNHQAFVILVALEVLLLCLRMLYFCMAYEHFGALLRMVLIVIKDMRFFFMLLLFLLCSFGLTFSVLLSTPATTNNISGNRLDGGGSDNPFSSFENAMLQLFTTMLGDVQFSTYQPIINLGTAPSRLAISLACIYAILVLIVLVNLLIAIVDETYGIVKESEGDQILRNKALIIDEIESTLTDACIDDLNSRVLLPYVHILVPQQSGSSAIKQRRDVNFKISKLKQYVKQHLRREPSALAAPPGAHALPTRPGDKGAQQQQQQHLQTRRSGGVELAALSVAVAELGQRIEAVGASSAGEVSASANLQAAALGEVSSKVDVLGAEVAALRELLLAVLEQAQQPRQQQHQQHQQQEQEQQ